MKINRLFITGLLLSISPAFANTINDPCAGPSSLLALVNRPSYADSACAVPYRLAVLEAGYQFQLLTAGGNAEVLPNAQFRLGLPANNEIDVYLPNYIHQNVYPRRGFTATNITFKHEIGYTEDWLGAAELVITTPTGSNTFGSKQYGTTVNGIVTYTINPRLSATGFLSIGSTTTSELGGGERFTTITPDVILSWLATDKILVYGEIFAQIHNTAENPSGYNFDGGILYLLTQNFAVDAEIGQRISGQFIGFNQYVGAGFSVRF